MPPCDIKTGIRKNVMKPPTDNEREKPHLSMRRTCMLMAAYACNLNCTLIRVYWTFQHCIQFSI